MTHVRAKIRANGRDNGRATGRDNGRANVGDYRPREIVERGHVKRFESAAVHMRPGTQGLE
jgi:hypothetical protein